MNYGLMYYFNYFSQNLLDVDMIIPNLSRRELDNLNDMLKILRFVKRPGSKVVSSDSKPTPFPCHNCLSAG